MPRVLSAEAVQAIERGVISARDFMTVYARDRETGNTVEDSLWSDLGNVNAQVINPDTGLPETRSFYGSGNLVSISDIPLVSNLSVQNVTIELSHLAANAEALLRAYDIRQSVVQIFRGLFNHETGVMVSAAFPRFSGFIDSANITTATENNEGQTTLSCASHTQEVTRANADTRSHVSQQIRSANDTFYQDSSTTTEWKIFWGQAKGATVATTKKNTTLGDIFSGAL